MDTPIMLTPSQLIGLFMGACGAIVAIAGAGAVIISFINKLRAPNKLQNTRLDKHDQMLNNDDARLKSLEKSSTITIKALLALLQHGIDGNDIESMKKVKHELEEYLIGR